MTFSWNRFAFWLGIFAICALLLPFTARADSQPSDLKTAIFAGGCFWCVESDFDKVDGVLETISGYSGGELENPTYKQVTYTETGHYEVVKVTYDPTKVTYPELVSYFFRHVDPTDDGGQFCDRGSSYRTAIFVADDGERNAAEAAKKEADMLLSDPVVTPILERVAFWEAEDYHQDFYLKNPLRYKAYRFGCRRDARVNAIWGEHKIN